MEQEVSLQVSHEVYIQVHMKVEMSDGRVRYLSATVHAAQL